MIEAPAADKCFTLAARSEIFEHVGADWADELLENLLKLGQRVADAEFFELFHGHCGA